MALAGGKRLLGRSRPQEEAEMDITPMIDCTFLLLIFFLVTSKMSADVGVELPKAKHGSAVVVKESIILTVAKGKDDMVSIYKGDSTDARNLIAGENVAEQEDALAEYVEAQSLSVPPKRYVLIKAQHDVRARDVARVAKAAARADVEQLYVGVLEEN
jgi:biopolymer transport protein ExbD